MRSWRVATIVTALALVHGLVPSASTVQQPPATPAVSPWAEWIEPDFPFFSSVLDAGRAGPGLPTRNLTPRGLIVNLGQGHWVGFDTDLLRVAAVWRGNAVTPKALAPGSYHEPDRKTQGGQSPPEPDGKVWAANGIYPGWQAGARPRSTIHANRRRRSRKLAAVRFPIRWPLRRRPSCARWRRPRVPCAVQTCASG